MKIIVTGGGTGGHIYPAIALIKALKKHDSEHDILYIGKENAQEQKICERENINFKGIKVRYIYRKLIYKNVLTLIDFINAYKKASKIIREFKPDIVIGTGGYVSSPVILAASQNNFKTIIHEQNSVPGLTNKWLAKHVNAVAISFNESKKFFKNKKIVFTGNPRAQEVYETNVSSKKVLGFDETKKLIVIFTGSQGAKYVNQKIINCLPQLSENNKLQILFITGPNHYQEMINEFNKFKQKNNIFIKPYIDNMPQILKVCDLVVCRAGATSLAEITSIGIPAILIPSPYVTNNHQVKNAKALSDNKAAITITESELTTDKLLFEINKLINNDILLVEMKKNSIKLGINDAANRFINLIESIYY